MIQELQKKQANLEIQKNFFIMMGGELENTQTKLSKLEIEKLKKDYVGMYYAFTSINWGQGMTLGMAWQKALEQMDAFVATKAKIPNHPANQELIKYHTSFKRDMARSIMQSKYANLKLREDFKKSFLDYGTKRLKEKKNSINNTYKKYMPVQQISKQPQSVQFDLARKKAEQLMRVQMLIIQQRERSA